MSESNQAPTGATGITPEKQKDKAEVTKSAVASELELLALEEKRLAIAFQKAQLEDMRERLDERNLRRGVSRSRSLTNGQTLKALAENDRKQQARCNHCKGGNGLSGYVGGQGTSSDMAVIKHKQSNGDLWVRCMRCGKTWKPPVAKFFKSQEEYLAAVAEYQAAVNFQTRNATSASIVFQFSDQGAYFRERTQAATLR